MTPTSATGDRRAGFTLVEVMVVVTIVGLAAGFVVLAVPDIRPSLSHEAGQLAAHLNEARQEAVLTNRTIEARLSAAGYDFDVAAAGGRTPLAAGPLSGRRWAQETRLAPVPLRISFDPTGQAQPVEVDLARGERRIAVSVDAAGNVAIHAPGR